ncbi:xanthine dehydrogenase family protein molybdopterin-binding subunit [Panacibacter sp. DH6]|uniref:Xanthine dehydrogenase family protein molybdopterin-binding subunit n=1 Tax=Panacibacter microcysteis TaxID=2793269 RepID=A0A931MCZ4_9BACT|nr:xanthine dehydrogenase family protein molybdopterin-binding subunit [Panacibacter microcysteis]MBG9378098.1 xanthine dehydrogenase family protein molybdopterin-binding subunit [Panacibacter microcysteis]
MTKASFTGQPVSRLEGKQKVTGTAKYAAEYEVPDLLYGYVVCSTIAKGTITNIDIDKAMAVDGVVEILTHNNRTKLAWFDIQYADMDAPPGMVLKPLRDTTVHFFGQPVALVLANDYETARYASTLVKIDYESVHADTYLPDHTTKAREPKKGLATALKPPPPPPTGDFEAAFESAPVKASAVYTHGTEHHNPMELFATTTVYEGKGKLTIYDKTQGTINSQVFVANIFGLKFKDVKVLAPFVGGGFGAGLRPQYQLFLCVMASLHMKRNVRVVLERKQMFAFAHRPQSIQSLRFGTTEEGIMMAMNHSTVSETSQYEDYTETVSSWSHKLYPCPNTLFEYKLVPLDVPTPLDMRAPGGSTGMHAIECMMDELAYKLDMDPVALRLKNYAAADPSTGKRYTSKALKECYTKAAAHFGWDRRNPQPGSMTRGNKLVGYGMATGIWDAFQFPSRVAAMLTTEGKIEINNAVTDIGTGTYTIMTQIAADVFGLPMEDIIFNYGNSSYPFSMFQGGSSVTASTSSGIVVAANELKKKILKQIKQAGNTTFGKAKTEDVIFKDSRICLKEDESIYLSFADVIALNKGRAVKATGMGAPHAFKLRKFSKATHSAVFVEVEVDKELKTVTVTRAVSAVAAGRIINPKTARSQILGSMVWGISKALMEETVTDKKAAKYINTNLAEYHIPVHADINDLEVIFADEEDNLINELGVKGVGEIGLVAVPAAIANAIFHATGKRINDLPIHFDKLL